ncbi:MAG TPA: hypothetical protein VF247_07715 [Candidatus Krumholzibacteria bacterium]
MSGRCYNPLRACALLAGVVAVSMSVAPAGPASAQMPPHPHQRSKASLTSTERWEYRILQNKDVKGHETIEKRVYDNNVVEFAIDAEMAYGPGVSMKQHIVLKLEEESFYPRSLHIAKTIIQPDSTKFEHTVDVDMVSNVAVVSSLLNGKGDSRRQVLPTGIPMCEVGILGYYPQILFWYDRSVGGVQRFQWFDPVVFGVNNGEIQMEKEETIRVMGKNVKASLFDLEREKLGPAKLWVDKDGVIVRGEMNFFVYEMLGKKKS